MIRLPNGPQWLTGNFGYTFAVPFEPTDAERNLLDTAALDPNHYQVFIINTMPLKRNKPTAKDMEWIMSRRLPLEKQTMGPVLPGQDSTPIPIPQLTLRVLDSDLRIKIPETQLNGGKMATAKAGIPLDSTAKYTLSTGIGAGRCPATVGHGEVLDPSRSGDQQRAIRRDRDAHGSGRDRCHGQGNRDPSETRSE